MNIDGNKVVWIVDDNEEILDALKIVLEQNNYVVKTQNDGLGFVEDVQKEPPDLILLDIFIGSIDGRELLKELKEDKKTKNIPVILASGNDTMIKSTKQGRYRADDFLAKPFALEELMNLVQKHLG